MSSKTDSYSIVLCKLRSSLKYASYLITNPILWHSSKEYETSLTSCDREIKSTSKCVNDNCVVLMMRQTFRGVFSPFNFISIVSKPVNNLSNNLLSYLD